jgi:hypothetical protein
MTATITPCNLGRRPRSWKRYTIGDVQISFVIQPKNKKHDIAIIDFEDAPFDKEVLKSVYEVDSLNCCLYVVLVADSEFDKVKAAAKELKLFDDVRAYSTTVPRGFIEEWAYIASVQKGASKGKNSSRSQALDKLLLKWVQSILKDFGPELKVIHPRKKKSGNEDIRITYKTTNIFHEENKRISELQNITERFSMVSGKSVGTKGELDDLFVSWIGYDLSFLQTMLDKSYYHIANAYVEFSIEEQKALDNDPTTTFEQKRILRPVDIHDISKGFMEGETLREFYVNTITAKIMSLKNQDQQVKS